VLIVGGMLMWAPDASAHDRITGSTPADRAVISAAPSQVQMTFTDQVERIGVAVIVVGPDGVRVALGKPVVDGLAVTQDLAPLTVNGEYSVAYRVVSSDGHPISGKLRFTLALPSVSASVSGTAPVSVSASAMTAAPVSAPAATSVSGPVSWIIAIAVLGVVVLTWFGIARAVRSRRR